MKNDYVYDLTLSYNKSKLLKEFEMYSLRPRGTAWLTRDIFNSSYEHLLNKIPEVNRVKNQVYKLIGDYPSTGVRWLCQKRNEIGNWHFDKKTKCSINIILSDKIGPIEFRKIGKINYTCAIINTHKEHMIPKINETRILLMFRIKELTYEEAVNKIKQNESLIHDHRQ